ncbi:MAG: four helix bundle protein [Pirellulales bacterium]|nr:four helix bundle protein [Pirellulales bacterium]
MAIHDYRDLIVWQKAIDLVEAIYLATTKFPREELYGLTIQLRRAAVSVPSNIAEGHGRTSTRDFLHFLSVSHGSLKEVETQIIIAERLKYIENPIKDGLFEKTSEVGRLISGLSYSLRNKINSEKSNAPF